MIYKDLINLALLSRAWDWFVEWFEARPFTAGKICAGDPSVERCRRFVEGMVWWPEGEWEGVPKVLDEASANNLARAVRVDRCWRMFENGHGRLVPIEGDPMGLGSYERAFFRTAAEAEAATRAAIARIGEPQKKGAGK